MKKRAAPPSAPPPALLNKARRLFAALRRHNPAPTTELKYESHFQLLTAVVLSAQATDRSVNLATPALFARAPAAKEMAQLGEDGIAAHIRSIGLFRSKARHLAALSKILLEKHGGQVPRARAELEALPGVGRKTANVVLNTAFGEPTIAVDTHIFRVANRTGLAPGKTPRAVEEGLLAVTPPAFKKNAHHWLILHGRYTCTAHRPKCHICPARRFCDFYGNAESESEKPTKSAKPKKPARR